MKRINEILDEMIDIDFEKQMMCDWCGKFYIDPEYCSHTFENKWNCKDCGCIYKGRLDNDVVLDFCVSCLQDCLQKDKIVIKRVGKWNS